MTPGSPPATWPVSALPPPGARDRAWPGRWPLRTQLELAALDTAPGSARAHVCAVLREWQASQDTADVAALIVTELLTNAVETTRAHGLHDPVRLWMLGERASVLFLIWDATVPAPVLRDATPDAERGRGLTVVNDLSERWGYYHPDEQPYGKVVWSLMRAESQPAQHPAVAPAWAQGKP